LACIYDKTMKKHIKILFLLGILAVLGCSSENKKTVYPDLRAPLASVKPHEVKSKHGHARVDNYYWLKERENQEVLDYLKAENDYLDSMLSHTKTFQKSLYDELKSRIKEDITYLPYFEEGYYYYYKYVKGGEYLISARKKGSLDAEEEIIIDGNELAKGKSYLYFWVSVSNDQNLAAIIMDTQGRNFYSVLIKDLKTGEFLKDKLENIRGNIAWTSDNKSFYYTVPDTVTLRNHQVKRHFIGQDSSKDELVFEEKDQTLDCGVGTTKSREYIIISSSRTDASNSYYIDSKNPGNPKLISPIEENVQYSVNHAGGGDFFIITNKNAPNYKLVKTPVAKSESPNWVDIIPNRSDILLERVDYFREFMAVEENKEGLSKIRIVNYGDNSSHEIAFDEPAYSADLDYNPAFDTKVVRYNYTSLTTPYSIFDYNMETKERVLMEESEVLGDFDKNNYRTERVMVDSRDGKKIPMSIVYKKDKFKKNGSNPGWIYGYGSYGSSTDASFRSSLLSLLDRGMVYSIAHVRGGLEMGGDWYEDGKMMNKKNTFNDFIDCSKWLLDNGYVAKDKLFASGGSAGGLLMGAVLNMAPELYRGVIAAVPFVDVVTTMMDETIPLTTFEWLEWGNPTVKEQYEYMLSYSPYDNVEPKHYPHILVTTGLHDSQVQYWEPAKWVAKLRALKTDKNNLFLYTNMDAGHGGASGRYEYLKEIAREFAFVFDILEIRK
jgi:oligopeptidase B